MVLRGPTGRPLWPRLLLWPCDWASSSAQPSLCSVSLSWELLIVFVGDTAGMMQAKALGTVIADITLHSYYSHNKQLLDTCCAYDCRHFMRKKWKAHTLHTDLKRASFSHFIKLADDVLAPGLCHTVFVNIVPVHGTRE